MTDDKQVRGPQDASRINVNEDYELRYWSERFGVSPEALKRAVEQVGVSAQAVEVHLQGNNSGSGR